MKTLIEKLEALRNGTEAEGFYTKLGMQGMLDACLAVVRKHDPWIPMNLNTAPDDGTPIVCLWQFNKTKWNQAVVAFVDDEWRDGDGTVYHGPDFWMPLPPRKG